MNRNKQYLVIIASMAATIAVAMPASQYIIPILIVHLSPPPSSPVFNVTDQTPQQPRVTA
jgi:hypothetical protein